jgi:hypothetical protein
MRSTTTIENVESVQIFDSPLLPDFDGDLTFTRDVRIKTRDGSEIAIFCFMGKVKNQEVKE